MKLQKMELCLSFKIYLTNRFIAYITKKLVNDKLGLCTRMKAVKFLFLNSTPMLPTHEQKSAFKYSVSSSG